MLDKSESEVKAVELLQDRPDRIVQFELKPCHECPMSTCAEGTGSPCPYDLALEHKLKRELKNKL